MPTKTDRRDDGNDDIERFLTAKETAGLLSISERHLANLSKKGEFPPPFKLGKAVRYAPKDIRQWIDGEWAKRNRPDGRDLAG